MPKHYAPDFYTRKRSSHYTYHYAPPGELDVARFVTGGKPYWGRETTIDKEEQKAIIISDWTAPYWLKGKTADVVFNLHQFIEDGFQIYYWNQDTLCVLNDPEILFDQDVRDRITLTSEDSLKSAALEQYRLLSKQVIIIDYHARPLLLGQQRIPKHCMLSEDLLKIKLTKTEITAIYPDFSEILVTTQYWDEELFSKNFPDVKLTKTTQYTQHKHYCSLASDNIDSNAIDHQQSSCELNIQIREPITNIDTKAIQAIACTTQSLTIEDLYTNTAHKTDIHVLFDTLDWIQLEKLSINWLSLPNGSLNHLKKLRSITLHNSTSTCSEKIPLIELNFPQIRELELASSDHYSSLSACLNLKKITTRCLSIEKLMNLFHGDFLLENLFEINISLSKTDIGLISLLRQIQYCAPNLKRITLSCVMGTRSGRFEMKNWGSIHHDFSFSDMVSAKLTFTYPLLNNIAPILKIFNQIESLSLCGPQFDNEIPPTDLFATVEGLKKLGSIFLQESKMMNDQFKSLFGNCNQLKSIHISKCDGLTGDFLSELPLFNLEEIVIDTSPGITYNAFHSLFSTKNSIKKIDFDFMPCDSNELEQSNLVKLESLRTEHIDPMILFNLTKNSKKLKFVHLSCRNITDLQVIKFILKNNKGVRDLALTMEENLVDDELVSLSEKIFKTFRYDLDDSFGYEDSDDESEDVNSDYDSQDINIDDESEDLNSDEKVSSSMSTSKKSIHTVDLDTAPREKTFHLTKIFQDRSCVKTPPVSQYRLQTFDDVQFKNGQFMLKNTGPIDLINPTRKKPIPQNKSKEVLYNYFQALMDEDVCMGTLLGEEVPQGMSSWTTANPNHYVGQQSFNNLKQKWEPIASLYPDEILINWTTTPLQEIEIKYSTRDDLYYVRNIKGTASFTLNFEITHAPRLYPPTLAQDVQRVIRYFKQFGSGALNNTKYKTLPEAVAAIMQAKVGACRHRAVAFFCYMKAQKPTVPIRIVTNDCHMFVEVYQDDAWITCDLGGYSAKLHTYEPLSRAIEAALSVASLPERPISPFEQTMDHSADSVLEKHLSEQFERQLISSKPPCHYDSLESYISTLFSGEQTTQRIDLSRHFLLRFHLTLKNQAQLAGHPIFYVHTPDLLVCSHPFIRLNDDGTGETCAGPGGALHTFLTQFDKTYKGAAPVLIINYTTFTEEDIASWNHILSEPRRTDTTELPSRMILLGLFDPSLRLNYDPSDFDFRFQAIHSAPDYLLDKREFTGPTDTPANDLPTERTKIQLCHSSNWQTLLLDHWILKDGKLQLEPGELTQALQLRRPIEIQNAPVSDDFIHFWALKSLELPADKPIFFTNGYQWDWNIDKIEQTSTPDLNAKILNPSQLLHFIKPYKLKGKQLSQESGWIADHANGTLFLYITRDLSEDEWGVFYKEYKKYPNLRLSFACAHNIAPPPGLSEMNLKITTTDIQQPLHTQWIRTNDMDLALELIPNKDEWTLLDISECQSADLLTRLTCTNKASYFFVEETKALLDAMKRNKKVILTGNFSDRLIDDLAVFLVNRLKHDKVTGQLILISDQPFPYLTPSSQQFFTWENKRAAHSSQFASDMLDKKPDAFRTLSFIQQKSALTYECKHPERSYLSAWDGLKSLYSGIRLIPFDPKSCEKDAIDFNFRRTQAFETALKNACYLVITGLTGVGKTTFVQAYFKDTLYQGSDTNTVTAWARKRQTTGIIPLFIDESNLLHRDWSEFEGLFHPKPYIFIDGAIYPVTQNHRVIFAGNPLSYSDDRKLARLFDRHGNSLVFDPLSTAFIYENIIKPIFSGTTIESDSVAQNIIGKTLLNVYQFIIESSEDSVLISPREVQMMTLLTVQDICKASSHPSESDIEDIARHHAYAIGKHLILTQKRPLFDRLYKPTECMTMPPKDLANNDFIYTESRLIVRQTLCNYLTLRANRQQKNNHLNNAQRYGGLGALIIEGPTGVGKTALVEDTLSFLKLRNGQDYLVIEPSVAFDTKKALLLSAFNKGQVVIMNEMNTSYMMEQLLNCLLMGSTPEGTRPDKPGFLIIGVQKSAALAGRQLPSNALARRIQTCYLPPYEDHELDDILKHKGVINAEHRAALITAFNKKQNLNPTFAHLMHVAMPYLSKKRAREVGPEETRQVSRSRISLWSHSIQNEENNSPTDTVEMSIS